MSEQQILDAVSRVMKEHLEIETMVDARTHLFRDLELDSLKQLTLVVELENHFRIRFDDGDEDGLQTVGDLVQLISARLERMS